ncbi:MAG TPA: CBS domain-containing protein [Anaerolineales bacterium]|jgi:tRNA nucleotidyltransferase (CCA-adding enzyme)
MHLVLTHEQADFDALAALFAATLIDGGLAILPRRMNRNVRAFITLYGLEFPFIDPRDVPQGPIQTVTLVDTQAMITLKGMGKDTKVQVIDHHPPRPQPKGKDSPLEWEQVKLELGATTTYFVEVFRDRGEALTPIQATLMLLGIYEDTGTLTYSRTTPRDVHAVAWLLEQGADLGSVTDFLNPPLSADQREVYDRLVKNIETHEINGHRIMLACAEASNPAEEISTLAHKLRDLFDPDALFVLVQTAEGVRFVARSATDLIDVSAITAHFGGGGHNRAAAALVKREPSPRPPLEVVREELIAMLPRHVRPPVTVAQLMSKRPRVIPADTPVQEAARLMSRYGYEGFPVVSDGKVVGLLTRRVVDRATSHRLNLTAASLMEAGSVSVHPGDSLQRLQTVMTDSGWGQVPVVDPETQKVVGIVTRTDVLKMLSRRHPHTAKYHSLAARLQKALPAKKLALIHSVADQASSEHLPVFIVGGFVRDLLLEHASTDFDMVVEGDAILLGKGLVAKFGGKLTSHTRFGSSRWYLAGSTLESPELPAFLDLISARQEFYEHPSALPTVEHGSIKLDLHRRDFTINTLALRLDGRHFGELHDYYGGLADLDRRLVRVLHSLSFIDDPTRMLRAVRYEQRYGFMIEPRTLQLMEEARPLVARLSPERSRHELDLILREHKPAGMLARLDELGLIGAISESLPWNSEIYQRLNALLNIPVPEKWARILPAEGHVLAETSGYCLWLLELPEATIDLLQERLCFPLGVLKSIKAAAALYAGLASLEGAKPSQWADRLDGMPLTAIYVASLVSGEKALEMYALKWKNIHPKTNGHSLKARGLQPGPYFEDILHALRSAWLDGTVNSNEAEEQYLEQLIRERISG